MKQREPLMGFELTTDRLIEKSGAPLIAHYHTIITEASPLLVSAVETRLSVTSLPDILF